MKGGAHPRGGQGRSGTTGQRSAPNERQLLLELAEHFGVLGSFLDGAGVERSAGSDALIAVLKALGAPLSGMSDVRDALRGARDALDARTAPPVVTAWEGEEVTVALRLPDSRSSRGVECRLLLEGGEVREWQAELHEAQRARRTTAGAHLTVPGELPLGVHELRLHLAGRETRTWIVRAPPTTWDPRTEEGWVGLETSVHGACDVGLFLPLHALRTARCWGTGDLTDLRALLAWSQARGIRFVGTLPLLSAFLNPGVAPFEPGPYAPVSRLFWNELYLDAERAAEVQRSARVDKLLGSELLRAEIVRLRDGARVRYADAITAKRRVLEALVAEIAPVDQPLLGPLAEYAERRPDATDYARFRAVGERLATRWSEWPSQMRDGHLESDLRDEAAFRYHLYVQHAFEDQLAELSGRSSRPASTEGAGRLTRSVTEPLPTLYLDLPLGAHPDGYDVWRYRDAFVRDLSAGSPPDPFFVAGQSWGFPPLHPERTRLDGHAYTRRSLAHVMRAAGMIRLDHVMSLRRLYCVPAGEDTQSGAYVSYPAEELYAVLCLESHRWKCEVVGEDLGTVPAEVHEAMERHHLRRMFVVPFELEGVTSETPRLRVPGPLSVASVGTHDLPPFAAFWSGEDIRRREKSGLLSTEEAARERAGRAEWRAALEAALGLERTEGGGCDVFQALRATLHVLAASPARHLLINVEDLWQETEPQNVPGTSGDRNWTLKARHPLERWANVEGLEETLAELVRTRNAKSRGRGGVWAR